MKSKRHNRIGRIGWSQAQADRMLILVTFAWSSSYTLFKMGLENMNRTSLIALRFAIAFTVISLLFPRQVRNSSKRVIFYGFINGTLTFMAIISLLFALETTTASTTGFLSTTSVIMVPIFQAIIKRRLPPLPIILGTIGTMIGITLLSLGDDFQFNRGAIYCLCAAFLYAIYIIFVDWASRRESGLLVGIWTLGFTGFWGVLFTLFYAPFTPPTTTQDIAVILLLALVCGCFGFSMQAVAQPFTTPEHTALIFSLEPVFSAVVAFIFLHEVLGTRSLIGAIIVFACVILTARNTTE